MRVKHLFGIHRACQCIVISFWEELKIRAYFGDFVDLVEEVAMRRDFLGLLVGMIVPLAALLGVPCLLLLSGCERKERTAQTTFLSSCERW
jgi:hypothetical protein